MRLSHWWICDDGISFAVRGLERLILSSSRQLQLGLAYTITHWIRPAIQTTMTRQLSSFTLTEIEEIGIVAYSSITRGKELIERERKLLAAYPPIRTDAVHDPGNVVEKRAGCYIRDCNEVWKELWWWHVARRLLHPVDPIPICGIPAFISTLSYPGLRPYCLEASALDLAGHKSFNVEITITNTVVLYILMCYGMKELE